MTNATKTIEEYLKPSLQSIVNIALSCKVVELGPLLRIVFSGAPVVSTKVESKVTFSNPFHHIPYSVSSYPMLCIIIFHTPYHHISCFPFHCFRPQYPHQRRDKVKSHNSYVHKWLTLHYPRVLYTDFWNLTADGVNRTSDGFHSLSDINVIKATYLLNIMDKMAENNSWYIVQPYSRNA